MLKRLFIYLNEMFPITALLGTVLMAIAVQLTYLRLFGIRPQFHYQMLLSGLVLTAVSLLIRVMDEFKDYQDDLINFPHRPLPSGRVEKSDLVILGVSCAVSILVLSATSTSLLLWGVITLSFTFLMLKWFFIEAIMRKSLPLAFISHHPIVVFNFIYLMLGMIVTFPGVNWSKAEYILPLCLIFTNWEVARKIRAPEQETSYTTYSKIFGPRVAISISLGLQAVYILTMFRLFHALQSPLFLQAVFGFLMILFVLPSVRFLLSLKLKAPLKTNGESQILVVVGFLLAAALI